MREPDAVPIQCSQHIAWVSAHQFERVSQYKWTSKKAKNRESIVIHRNDGGKMIELSRFILEYDCPLQIDHVDRDRLNNCDSNLRIATNRQNMANQGLKKSNTSGFKGVSWHAQAGKWYAQIRINGKKTNLGLYDSPEEAARAYDKAAILCFGEFAFTNSQLSGVQ